MIMNECIEQSVDMYGVRNVMLFLLVIYLFQQ